MKTFAYLLLVPLLFALSCRIESEKINYGNEACHFCKMTIVDKQHASELVTSKGKAYKYDAIECMLHDLKQRDNSEIGLLYVNDYNHPGSFIKAETATFLVSDSIPSPMGAFLSAFASKDEAQKAKTESTGTLYTWESIQTQTN